MTTISNVATIRLKLSDSRYDHEKCMGLFSDNTCRVVVPKRRVIKIPIRAKTNAAARIFGSLSLPKISVQNGDMIIDFSYMKIIYFSMQYPLYPRRIINKTSRNQEKRSEGWHDRTNIVAFIQGIIVIFGQRQRYRRLSIIVLE